VAKRKRSSKPGRRALMVDPHTVYSSVPADGLSNGDSERHSSSPVESLTNGSAVASCNGDMDGLTIGAMCSGVVN